MLSGSEARAQLPSHGAILICIKAVTDILYIINYEYNSWRSEAIKQ
jgi:hypothetical protein